MRPEPRVRPGPDPSPKLVGPSSSRAKTYKALHGLAQPAGGTGPILGFRRGPGPCSALGGSVNVRYIALAVQLLSDLAVARGGARRRALIPRISVPGSSAYERACRIMLLARTKTTGSQATIKHAMIKGKSVLFLLVGDLNVSATQRPQDGWLMQHVLATCGLTSVSFDHLNPNTDRGTCIDVAFVNFKVAPV
ncbi:hypothetical protein HPB51_020624 [Rhipicephalus microplus]|uniref:Uncharacterized protein n=1 Tax=Rhipicephalus microplus TaxID=6941 RepID=A0A9J6DJC8_RHIMP|nr:hypothetical protein HPB51_020624 [Rhipicephalus microplus]